MHPHIARLNPSNLEVRYRASEKPQLLTVRVLGVPKYTWKSDYPTRVFRIRDTVNSGFAGGVLFAPELGHAEIIDGPIPSDQSKGPEFVWTLKVQAVDPRWFVLALDHMADSWSVTDNLAMGERFEPSPEFYPRKVSLIGEHPLDASQYSVQTAGVLEWLREPSPAYQAWPEFPFAVKESPATKGVRLRLKTSHATAAVEEALGDRLLDLGPVLEAHPLGGWPNLSGQVAAGKTQLTVKWDDGDFKCPGSIARGSILNLLRAFHFQVAPLTQVELNLPEG